MKSQYFCNSANGYKKVVSFRIFLMSCHTICMGHEKFSRCFTERGKSVTMDTALFVPAHMEDDS